MHDPGSAEPLRFAGAELQRYMAQILGVPVSTNKKSPCRIVLREIEDKEIGDEGIEISCDSRTLTISGAPTGIVYGVFEFLAFCRINSWTGSGL